MFGAIELSLGLDLLIFAASSIGVWKAGKALATSADKIAEAKRFSKAIMGLVFLAAATELPEIATTATAAIAGNATLLLNNMFGGITLQTAILALADGLIVRGVLTQYPRKTSHALEAGLLVILLSLLLGICLLGDRDFGVQLGIGTLVLAGAYFVSIKILRAVDEKDDWVPIDFPDGPGLIPKSEEAQVGGALAVKPMLVRAFIAAGVILVCGVLLVHSAEAIALKTGLGASFIGATILAASTSLPELSTTFAAVRLGAYTMAISNIFGSNLIMLVLLLPADALYRQGPVLAEAGRAEMLTLVFGILLTAIYFVGIVVRRKPKIFGMGMDSALVLVVYVTSVVALYSLR